MNPRAFAAKVMAMHIATGLPVLRAREFLANQPEDLVERILRAASARTLPGAKSMDQLVDPIEDDPCIGPIVRRIKDEVHAALLSKHEGSWPRGLCYKLWQVTKDRLMSEHGICWYSPAEMNPASIFD